MMPNPGKHLASFLFVLAVLHSSIAWSQGEAQPPGIAEREAKVQGITPGAKVRVQTLPSYGSRTGEKISGKLKSCQAGVMTLVVSVVPEQTLRLPISKLVSVEVSEGGQDFKFIGLLVGLAAGGLVASKMETEKQPGEWLDFGLDAKAAGVVTLGGVVGLLLGSAASTDSWVTVFDEPVALSLVVGRQGETEVALGFRF